MAYMPGERVTTHDGREVVLLHHCTGAIECLIGYIELDDGSQIPGVWSPSGHYISRDIMSAKKSIFDLVPGGSEP